MKFPDFICIGIQKAGTTSLYNYLCQHPQVIANNYKKEVKFWNYVYDKGIDWYKSCFPDEPNKITGDVTSNYFWYVDPKVMYNDLPKNTKLMVIFRNPIDRAYSFYWWLKTRCPCEKHPLKDTFEQSIDVFKDESDYLKYLKPWIDVFGWDRLLVVIFEKLFISNSLYEWKRITDYLNITNHLPDFKPYLKQNYEPILNDTRIHLQKYFEDKNKQFFKYIKQRNVWR